MKSSKFSYHAILCETFGCSERAVLLTKVTDTPAVHDLFIELPDGNDIFKGVQVSCSCGTVSEESAKKSKNVSTDSMQKFLVNLVIVHL